MKNKFEYGYGEQGGRIYASQDQRKASNLEKQEIETIQSVDAKEV